MIDIVGEDDVKNSLHDLGIFIEDEKVLTALYKMCIKFSISSDKLAENWYEFKSKNPKVGLKPHEGHLEIFEKNHLAKEYIRDHEIGKINDHVSEDMDQDEKVNVPVATKSDAETNDPVIGNQIREEAGGDEMVETVLDAADDELTADERNALLRRDIVAAYGAEGLEESDFQATNEFTVTLKPVDESKHVKQTGYHFCGFNLNEMCCIAEDQLREAASFYSRNMGIPFVTDLSQDLIDDENAAYLCFVRKQPHKVKLNADSMLVEGTGDAYDNEETIKHMPVDLTQLSSYSFFPGQIIAFRGIRFQNTMRILSLLDPPSHTPVDRVFEPASLEFQLIVVSGPFSSAEKVESLGKYVTGAKPHLMILIGPFVDARDFDACVNRDDDETFTSTLVSRLCKAGAQKVVLVPSMHDLNAVNVVPTPPLAVDHPKAVSFPDPCYFSVNGIQFAVTSLDILKHMLRQEFSSGLPDRMRRIASHLLNQRRLYPLFPVDREANVDYRSHKFLQFPCHPDFLIMPSDLQSFVLNVEDCICLNPQRITKGFLSRIRVRLGEHHHINPDVQVFKI